MAGAHHLPGVRADGAVSLQLELWNGPRGDFALAGDARKNRGARKRHAPIRSIPQARRVVRGRAISQYPRREFVNVAPAPRTPRS